ncbi:MAG TPA: hypothetical protein VFV92_09530 [Candidatus Bathyarchaeia archaeon]|nr:hypothetical protein [Candidatus Bathyarchaeia archaeon]
MRLGLCWFELRLLVKGSSVLGLVIGGLRSYRVISLLGQWFFSPEFVSLVNYQIIVFLTMLVLFGGPLAFGSSLCLILLDLPDEKRNVLGFLALKGSITTLVVLLLFSA